MRQTRLKDGEPSVSLPKKDSAELFLSKPPKSKALERHPSPLSTTWEGMRLVVDAMAAKGWELELRYNGERAIADFHNHGRCRRVKYATAPHAVAIAALLALESDHAR